MKNKSRVKNVMNNVFFSLICQAVNLIMQFVGRTVFIHTLTEEYLGINGLFANILTILSFAELGIGEAIIFNLYKPLAENDRKKTASLMLLYKKAYTLIGIFVAVAGVCVVPFLNVIIKDTPDIAESLTLVYLLFLFDTASSYFFAYKKSIIIADQQNYLVELYTQGVKVCMVILQCAVLLTTGNYIAYLLLQIAGTLCSNIVLSRKAEKMYPYLKDKAEKLPKSETANIFKNVRSLVIYKFGSVILNGTDNIIISATMKVAYVGLVSNYNLIINACSSVLGRVVNAFTASLGNVNAIEKNDKKYFVFRKVFMINSWMYGFVAVCLQLLTNDFIRLWIGEKYVLSEWVLTALALHFYIFGVHSTASTYRTTLGLFVKGKIAPVLAAILNIFLSLWLGKLIGLSGIFFATSISRILTMGIVDPIIVFNKIEQPVFKYYLLYAKHAALSIALCLLLKYAISFIKINSIFSWILAAIVVAIGFNGIMLAVFAKNKEFRDIAASVKRRII